MGNLSSYLRTPNDDSSSPVRIFWALAIGLLTLAMLVVGGITALQNATIIMGLPFAFVLLLVMYGLYKALRVEGFREDSRRYSMPARLSGRTTGDGRREEWTWRQRLSRAMNYPDYDNASRFLSNVALPALHEVSAELRDHGVEAEVIDDTDNSGIRYVELTVDLGEATPFRYQVIPRRFVFPRYGERFLRGEDVYYRLEVHLREGGQDYDVMGYTHDQLIADVLDQYEQHVEFMRLNAIDAQ
jgi:choline/glycine/proline betaine transport protein